ncbi:type II pantothenate kinase [Lentibacillus sediminis]|uniref:type II pantothenate kinase n=1 Tax=Lentibacillus sediminis TaxID=1940529 RepID=UPI0013046A24|nr:type II pantothenate kinase [Lentibacillus sediminis]
MRKIGIDAGGTLTKVAYQENGHMHVKTFSNQKQEEILQWLQLFTPDARFCLTGGRSASLQGNLQQKIVQIDEFQAIAEGTKHLLHEEKATYPDEFILVSIGTGTSIFHVNSERSDRLFGSGIGGGTWMGLGILLTGKDDFRKLVRLAGEGDSAKGDLLVKDIYQAQEAPLLGELTAANFGKAADNREVTSADSMASLARMIGETIMLLASQAAAKQQVEKIVFAGSTLDGNRPLRDVLNGFREMLPYEPIFLEKGAYAGAIGALLEG